LACRLVRPERRRPEPRRPERRYGRPTPADRPCRSDQERVGAVQPRCHRARAAPRRTTPGHLARPRATAIRARMRARARISRRHPIGGIVGERRQQRHHEERRTRRSARSRGKLPVPLRCSCATPTAQSFRQLVVETRSSVAMAPGARLGFRLIRPQRDGQPLSDVRPVRRLCHVKVTDRRTSGRLRQRSEKTSPTFTSREPRQSSWSRTISTPTPAGSHV
jgi:hypothetical protein